MSTSNDDPGATSGPPPPAGPAPDYPPPGSPPPGSYGPPGSAPGYRGDAPAAPRNGLGTAAMVIGIIAVPAALVLVGGVLGIVAIVLGFLGLGKVRAGQATNRGMAVAGIVLGIVALLITAFITFLLIDNADEIENFADCMEDAIEADDDAAADRCGEQFEDDLQD